ncbi:MAG: hypothetical protein QQW96_16800 [Tychonema bourrellyi B0820]|uniref:hypothetical protein n=1 Tax=Tychonema bourrellyi TaxID=54313 RepID=UPI0015D4BE41|nr:hypothetical protein [Tychonema bourrellyi]MDQ2099290.1 hypothetical protein [Tychonema bourrellyi B0820]
MIIKVVLAQRCFRRCKVFLSYQPQKELFRGDRAFIPKCDRYLCKHRSPDGVTTPSGA